jgi:hypothetical protein
MILKVISSEQCSALSLHLHPVCVGLGGLKYPTWNIEGPSPQNFFKNKDAYKAI